MAYGKGKITAPVEIQDPYAALGVGRPSGGYDLGSLIEQHHDRINRWARYKPVQYYNGPFASVPGNDPDWWRARYPPGSGHDGDCGLALPAAPGDQTSWFGCADESFRVGYRPPTGGMQAPFRLSDWAGYDHGAVCPVRLEMPSAMRVSNAPSYLRAVLSFPDAGDGSLRLEDIRPDAASDMGSMYLTLAVTTASSAQAASSANTRFFQPQEPVSDGAAAGRSVMEVSLDCGLEAERLDTAMTDLGFHIAPGTEVRVLAMLGARLPDAVALGGGRGVRGTAPPSPWSTLYYEDRPSARLVLTEHRVYAEIAAEVEAGTEDVVLSTQGGRGSIDLQRLAYRLRYTPAVHVDVFPTVRAYADHAGTREYLVDTEIRGSVQNAPTDGSRRTMEVHFPPEGRAFLLDNAEAASYGTSYTLEIGLGTTARNMVVKGSKKGTLVLDRATGIWTARF